ncbi:MAG: cytochrome c peroxidase [Gemmatimonadota bacterium]
MRHSRMPLPTVPALLLTVVAAAACGPEREGAAADAEARTDVAVRPEVSPLFEPLPEEAEHPETNPGTPERIDLGHKLFFEPRLSRSGVISCNTCHVVGAAGVDSREVAIGEGARTGPRNSPTVFNAAFLGSQFWDGRAPTLEEQAKGPIQAHVEMDLTPEEAVQRMRETGYAPLFRAAFPDEEEPLTFDNLAKAIAAFERTLITPGSAFDRYLAGELDALTEQEREGLALFESVGCVGCHSGVLLGGNGFARFSHVEGRGDIGRADVTGRDEDRYVFRIAPLRNVELTAPYFHDGSVATLSEAVAIMGSAQLSRRFDAEEVGALTAFLRSLTGEFPLIAHPRLPRGAPLLQSAGGAG